MAGRFGFSAVLALAAIALAAACGGAVDDSGRGGGASGSAGSGAGGKSGSGGSTSSGGASASGGTGGIVLDAAGGYGGTGGFPGGCEPGGQEAERGSTTCSYVLPPAPGGRPTNPNLVNVEIVYGGGGEHELVFFAGDPDECDPVSGGWYYDDRSNPTSFSLCPETCARVANDPSALVVVLHGCYTNE